MNSIRTVFAVCFQNFRKWRSDYRIWIIAVTLIIMIQIYVDDLRKASEFLGTEIPIWIFPFMYSQFHTKLIYTLPVIMLFCNAPFIDGNQVFVYTRVGRNKWLCGQILYIIFASAAYYIFLIAASLLSTVFIGEISLDWGETLSTLSSTDTAVNMGLFFLEIPKIVTDFFSPLQAVGFTFLVSWLCAVMLGLLIFLCNTLTGTKFLGTLISSALVVLSVLVENGGYQHIIKFSPVSWNTLDNIDVGGFTTNPEFLYCLFAYIGLIVFLTAGIFIIGKTKRIDMKGN